MEKRAVDLNVIEILKDVMLLYRWCFSPARYLQKNMAQRIPETIMSLIYLLPAPTI